VRRVGYEVFLYSDEQPELSGQDGDSVFYSTFREEARICVVLYRQKWGRTRWTGTEERAIRDRITSNFQRPEEFLLIINLEQALPDIKWLPEWIIWNDYEAYGVDGAAGAISSFARRARAIPKPETAESLAERKARERDWRRDAEVLLRSVEGQSRLKKERETVFQEINSIALKAREQGWNLTFKPERSHPAVTVLGEMHTLVVSWQSAFYGAVNVSSLWFRLFEYYLPAETILKGEEPVLLEETNFTPYVTPSMDLLWQEEKKPGTFNSRELADHIMKRLLERLT